VLMATTVLPLKLHTEASYRLSYLYLRPLLWSEFFNTDPRVPGSIPRHYKKKVGLEQGPLSLVSTTEELLD
jgi:hypothetical protein